jgi:hypothetical protein
MCRYARGPIDLRMHITLADPTRVESLLAYLRAHGCVAYAGGTRASITAVVHDGFDKAALVRLVAAWTALELDRR